MLARSKSFLKETGVRCIMIMLDRSDEVDGHGRVRSGSCDFVVFHEIEHAASDQITIRDSTRLAARLGRSRSPTLGAHFQPHALMASCSGRCRPDLLMLQAPRVRSALAGRDPTVRKTFSVDRRSSRCGFVHPHSVSQIVALDLTGPMGTRFGCSR